MHPSSCKGGLSVRGRLECVDIDTQCASSMFLLQIPCCARKRPVDDRLTDCSGACRGATKGSGGFETVSDGLDMPEGM